MQIFFFGKCNEMPLSLNNSKNNKVKFQRKKFSFFRENILLSNFRFLTLFFSSYLTINTFLSIFRNFLLHFNCNISKKALSETARTSQACYQCLNTVYQKAASFNQVLVMNKTYKGSLSQLFHRNFFVSKVFYSTFKNV